MIAITVENVATVFSIDAGISAKILADFIVRRKKMSLKIFKGKLAFKDDYDYKSMRN